MHRTVVVTLALAAALAPARAPLHAQTPSFAGVWVLDSIASAAPATAVPAAGGPAGAAGGAVAPDNGGYRSVVTITQLDSTLVVERRLEDRARRPVAAPERFSYRLDDVERSVPWTSQSGEQGTATLRARRVPDAPAVMLLTTRRLVLAPDRVRATQAVERLDLVPGGQLRLTRTEYDGRRERRRVYWFSRG